MNINFIQQFKHLWRVILVLIIVLNLVFLCVFLISSLFSISIEFMLEDTASLYGFNQFSGFTTSIGALILSCGIGAVLLLLFLNQRLIFDRKGLTSMVIMGLITLFLFLDDVFLLHERVITGLLHIGERSIYLIYILSLGAVIYYRRDLLSEMTVFLVIALLLFGLSVSIDVLIDKGVFDDTLAESAIMLEEYFKLGGYLFWTTFIILKAKMMIIAHLGRN